MTCGVFCAHCLCAGRCFRSMSSISLLILESVAYSFGGGGKKGARGNYSFSLAAFWAYIAFSFIALIYFLVLLQFLCRSLRLSIGSAFDKDVFTNYWTDSSAAFSTAIFNPPSISSSPESWEAIDLVGSFNSFGRSLGPSSYAIRFWHFGLREKSCWESCY